MRSCQVLQRWSRSQPKQALGCLCSSSAGAPKVLLTVLPAIGPQALQPFPAGSPTPACLPVPPGYTLISLTSWSKYTWRVGSSHHLPQEATSDLLRVTGSWMR